MTTTAPHADIDEARVQGLVGQILTDLAGAAATATTVVGDRLGLYRAMAGAGPVTAAEVAVGSFIGLETVSQVLTGRADLRRRARDFRDLWFAAIRQAT